MNGIALTVIFAGVSVALATGMPLYLALPGLGLAWFFLGWKAVRKLTIRAMYARSICNDAWGQKRMTLVMLKNNARIEELDDRKQDSLCFHAVLLLTWPLHEMTFGFSYRRSTMTACLGSTPFVRSIESALTADGINVDSGLDDNAIPTAKEGRRTTQSCLVSPMGAARALIWLHAGPTSAKEHKERAVAVKVCLLSMGYSVYETDAGWIEVRNSTPPEFLL